MHFAQATPTEGRCFPLTFFVIVAKILIIISIILTPNTVGVAALKGLLLTPNSGCYG